MKRRKKYYHTIQLNLMDCCTACVVSLFKYWGYNVDYAKVKKELNNTMIGTTIRDFNSCFLSFNIKTHTYIFDKTMNYNNLNLMKKDQFPCMAVLEIEQGNHFIVIYKISKNKVYYSDPSFGKIKKNKLDEVFENLKYIFVFDHKCIKIPNDLLIEKGVNSNIFKGILIDEKQRIVNIFIFSLFSSLITIMLAFKLGIVIDVVIPAEILSSKTSMMIVFLFFQIISLCLAIFVYFEKTFSIRLIRGIEKKLYHIYCDKLLKLKAKSYKDIRTGEIISRLNEGISTINLFANLITNSSMDILFLFISIIILFFIDIQMTLLVIFFLLLLSLLMYCYYDKIYNHNHETQKKYAVLNSSIIEYVENINQIKTLNSGKFQKDKMYQELDSYIAQASKTEAIIVNAFSYQQFLLESSGVFILYLSCMQALNMNLSIGTIVIYLNIVSILFSSTLRLLNTLFEFEKFLVSYTRFKSVLESNAVEQIVEHRQLPKFNKIEIKDFSISYGLGVILKNLNVIFDSNNIVICGESGSGKTTLAKCLVKLEEDYIGDIKLNGINIKNINSDDLRSKVLYVSGNDTLFDGSIWNNLCLGKSVSRAFVEKVCDDFCIGEFIRELPGQFNYQISYGAKNVSLGQNQRLILARAMICLPDIIIFDEALSNIDTENRKTILNNLKNYDCMKIFITHNEIIDSEYKVLNIKNNTIQSMEESKHV